MLLVALAGAAVAVEARDGARRPAASARRPSTAATAPHTLTYVVTGAGSAAVQYGPAGSDLQGHAPMSVTQPLGNPSYYAISAQLQGGGAVSCQLEVDGQVISQATASGGYDIASCEISKDPRTGNWTATDQG
ncbi:hypothetical protein ACIGXM_18675 [Kitasatospora sp. NPDC052896]|uniref:hypothetical protein n=1 Tax=Kitasatospora sp. NPDC052896 TaxID=3364061 RepID=UPI0037CC94AC